VTYFVQHVSYTRDDDQLEFALHLTNHQFLVEAIGSSKNK
jgi:hypothetical protein